MLGANQSSDSSGVSGTAAAVGSRVASPKKRTEVVSIVEEPSPSSPSPQRRKSSAAGLGAIKKVKDAVKSGVFGMGKKKQEVALYLEEIIDIEDLRKLMLIFFSKSDGTPLQEVPVQTEEGAGRLRRRSSISFQNPADLREQRRQSDRRRKSLLESPKEGEEEEDDLEKQPPSRCASGLGDEGTIIQRTIKEEEFVRCVKLVLHDQTTSDIRRWYRRIDSGGDGIDWDEFSQFILNHGQPRKATDERRSEFATKALPSKCLTMRQHSDFITRIVTHPRTGNLYTCSRDGSIREWHHETLQMLNELFTGNHWITGLCFMKGGGNRLLMCSCDRTVSIFDVRSGEMLKTYMGNEVKETEKGIKYALDTVPTVQVGYTVQSYAAPKNVRTRALHSGGQNEDAKILNFEQFKEMLVSERSRQAQRKMLEQATLAGLTEVPLAVAHPTHDMLAAKKKEDAIRGVESSGTGVSGTTTVGGGAAAGIGLVPGTGSHEPVTDPTKDIFTNFNQSAQGSEDIIYLGLRDGSIMCYKLPVLPTPLVKPYSKWTHVHEGRINDLQIVPYLNALLSCSDDMTVKLCDLFQGRILRCFNHKIASIFTLNSKKPNTHGVHHMAWSEEYKIVVTSSPGERVVYVWNHLQDQPIYKIEDHLAPMLGVQINEQNGQLITMSVDGTCKVWEIRTNLCVQTFSENRSDPGDNDFSVMTFDPQRQRIVCGSTFPQQYQLRKKAAAFPPNYLGHTIPVYGSLYSSEYEQVVSTDNDTIIVWAAATGECCFTYSLQSFIALVDDCKLTSFSLDRSQKRLLTGFASGIVVIWNFSNGAPLNIMRTTEGHCGEVYAVAALERMQQTFYMAAVGNELWIALDTGQFTITKQSRWPVPKEFGFVTAIGQCSPHVAICGTSSGAMFFFHIMNEKMDGNPLWVSDYDETAEKTGASPTTVALMEATVLTGARSPTVAGVATQARESSPQSTGHTQSPSGPSAGSPRKESPAKGKSPTSSRTSPQARGVSPKKGGVSPKKGGISPKSGSSPQRRKQQQTSMEKTGAPEPTLSRQVAKVDSISMLHSPAHVLMAAHSDGRIAFWNHFQRLHLWSFNLGTTAQTLVSMIVLDPHRNDYFAYGDELGNVYIWHIKIKIKEHSNQRSPSPKRVGLSAELERETYDFSETQPYTQFHTHMKPITSITFARLVTPCVVTTSEDCSTRLYTFQGQCIGYYGVKTWSLASSATWTQPKADDTMLSPNASPRPENRVDGAKRSSLEASNSAFMPPVIQRTEPDPDPGSVGGINISSPINRPHSGLNQGTNQHLAPTPRENLSFSQSRSPGAAAPLTPLPQITKTSGHDPSGSAPAHALQTPGSGEGGNPESTSAPMQSKKNTPHRECKPAHIVAREGRSHLPFSVTSGSYVPVRPKDLEVKTIQPLRANTARGMARGDAPMPTSGTASVPKPVVPRVEQRFDRARGTPGLIKAQYTKEPVVDDFSPRDWLDNSMMTPQAGSHSFSLRPPGTMLGASRNGRPPGTPRTPRLSASVLTASTSRRPRGNSMSNSNIVTPTPAPESPIAPTLKRPTTLESGSTDPLDIKGEDSPARCNETVAGPLALESTLLPNETSPMMPAPHGLDENEELETDEEKAQRLEELDAKKRAAVDDYLQLQAKRIYTACHGKEGILSSNIQDAMKSQKEQNRSLQRTKRSASEDTNSFGATQGSQVSQAESEAQSKAHKDRDVVLNRKGYSVPLEWSDRVSSLIKTVPTKKGDFYYNKRDGPLGFGMEDEASSGHLLRGSNPDRHSKISIFSKYPLEEKALPTKQDLSTTPLPSPTSAPTPAPPKTAR